MGELARPFSISQPAISRHIRVLTESGLVVQSVQGTKRPCRIARGGLDHLDAYLGMLRGALERNYQRLDHLLAKSQGKKGRSK